MKIRTLFIVLFLFVPICMFAQTTLTIEGSEDSYNQIRVINETSQENFYCRVSVIRKGKTKKEVYSIFELKGKKDIDSKTNINRIQQGEQIVIEMPKNFPVKVSFSLEYKDYPLWDAILIHIYDETTQFEGDDF